MRRLIDDFRPLIESAAAAEPGRFDLAALATVLHSFYGGVENMMKRIAIEIDGAVPKGEASHADLLSQVANATAARPAFIDAALRDRLGDYLRFRHVFRHAYAFELSWSKMAPLVYGLLATANDVERAMDQFLAEL